MNKLKVAFAAVAMALSFSAHAVDPAFNKQMRTYCVATIHTKIPGAKVQSIGNYSPVLRSVGVWVTAKGQNGTVYCFFNEDHTKISLRSLSGHAPLN